MIEPSPFRVKTVIKCTTSRRLSWKRSVPFLAVAGWLLLAGGCAQVQPWQRGAFTDYGMRADRDPLAEGLAEHVFFTREAASGGRAVGGGGCGCN